MGRFEGFYTGGTSSASSSIPSEGSQRAAQPNSNVTPARYKSRQERVWAMDYQKCSTKEDYQDYIRRYQRYSANPFVAEAQNELEVLLEYEEELDDDEDDSSSSASATVSTPIVNKSQKEKDPYLVFRILGSIAVFFVLAAIAISFGDKMPGWLRAFICICAGPGVIKWFWNRD